MKKTSLVVFYPADKTSVTAKQGQTVKLSFTNFHDGQKRTVLVLNSKLLYIPKDVLNVWSCFQLVTTGNFSSFVNCIWS